jgi:hypothetical protein
VYHSHTDVYINSQVDFFLLINYIYSVSKSLSLYRYEEEIVFDLFKQKDLYYLVHVTNSFFSNGHNYHIFL